MYTFLLHGVTGSGKPEQGLTAITRMAVSPDGKWLAMVVDEASPEEDDPATDGEEGDSEDAKEDEP